MRIRHLHSIFPIVFFLLSSCDGSSRKVPLFYLPPEAIFAFEIEEGEKKIRFEKDEESGNWTGRSEETVFIADGDTVVSFLRRYGQLEAIPLIASRAIDFAKYGLDRPLRKVRLFPTLGTERVLHFGNRDQDGRFYLFETSRSAVYLYEDQKPPLLAADANLFRDRAVIHFEEKDIVSFAVTPAGKRGRIVRDVRDGESWTLGGKKIDPRRIAAWFTGLRALRISEFIETRPEDLAGLGLNPPKFGVVLSFEQGGDVTLSFGRKDETKGGTYARTSTSPEILLISSTRAEELVRAWEGLVSPGGRSSSVFEPPVGSRAPF